MSRTYRHQNDGLDAEYSNVSAQVNNEPSLTVQSMAEDADLNVMMARMRVTGQMPESVRVPQYGDFTGVSDYQSALHAVMEADEKFMELPAGLRARFNNDPQDLLDFVHDDANMEEARKLGLLKEKVNVSVREVGGDARGEVQASGAGVAGDGKASGGGA